MRTTIEEYVQWFHCTLDDLTEEELKAVEKEVEAYNNGHCLLDGVLTHKWDYK